MNISITSGVALEKVKADGLTLKNMANDLKTTQICIAAVNQNGLALQYVPDGIKDIDICIIAVKQNSSALQYVPENLKDEVKKKLGLSEPKLSGPKPPH
ncbi:MAG: DUF4116 domain-containing protein [Treponema sp.]|jgi:hypothetical protein|nr:DUF4116 domain-containing protein [Treponema sp.]